MFQSSNPEEFQKYRGQTIPTVEAHGGKILATGKPEVLEGTWNTKRIVILEFPSMEKAKAWYNSREYGPLNLKTARSLMWANARTVNYLTNRQIGLWLPNLTFGEVWQHRPKERQSFSRKGIPRHTYPSTFNGHLCPLFTVT